MNDFSKNLRLKKFILGMTTTLNKARYKDKQVYNGYSILSLGKMNYQEFAHW